MKTAALVLSLIGALAWIPWIYESLQRPQIHGRIVSFFVSRQMTFSYRDDFTDTQDSVSGPFYCLRLSLVCLKRDFAIRSCSVHVRYSNDPTRHIGFLPVARITSLEFTNGSRKYLRIPPDEDLAFTTVLEKDRVNKRYASFIVPEAPHGEPLSFEAIELTFIDYSNFRRTLVLKKADIDPKSTYYDESILFDKP